LSVRVFFGTDRKKTGETAPAKFFAAERGDLSLGSVDVSIPHDHRMGELEGPSIWKLQFSDDPSKHVVLLGVEILTTKNSSRVFAKAFNPLHPNRRWYSCTDTTSGLQTRAAERRRSPMI